MLSRVLPRRNEARWVLVGVLMSAIGRGLTLPFLFIYLTEVRHLNDTEAGLVIGWLGATSLALSPLGGTLIDRFGARAVVIPCLLIEAAGTGSLALVDSVGSAFLAVTVCAIGNSAFLAAQAMILASLTDARERQRTFGLQFTLLNVGLGLGGLIAGAIVDTAHPGTFQTVYVLDAVSFLAPVAIILAMPHIGRRTVQVRADDFRDKGEKRGGYREVLRDRPFRRLVAFGLVLTVCGYAQIQVGFSAYATRVVHVTPQVVAWALAANTVVIVVAQLVMIKALDRRSRAKVLALVGVLFATAWLVLGMGGIMTITSPGSAALCVGLCAAVFGLGETLLSPVLPALTNALATDELRGRYNSFTSIITGVGGVVAPISTGPLMAAGGGALWVGLVMAGCLAASLMALSLRKLLTPVQDGRIPAAPATGTRERAHH